MAALAKTKGLGELSNLVFQALTAQLPEAAAKVSEAFEQRAGQATDCLEMLSALPPIADVLRYGKARELILVKWPGCSIASPCKAHSRYTMRREGWTTKPPPCCALPFAKLIGHTAHRINVL